MNLDEDLIDLIEELHEPASRSFAYQHVSARERPADVPDIWELAERLQACLDAHPDFSKASDKFFLGKQLSFSTHQSVNLLRVAQERGAAKAIDWYRRVIRITCAKMRVVAEVQGLQMQDCHTFSNGIKLLPAAKLPDSANSLVLKRTDYIRMEMHWPTAVMFELDDVEEEHSDIGHERFLEMAEKMRKTVTAFVLSDDAAAVMGAFWAEFVDPELQAAEFGRMWQDSRHEGRFPNAPANVTEEMLNWVEKYLQLPAEVSKACDIPIARLNLARRRLTPEDKAMDGCICLEALLSGDGSGDLTHRLSVRTALLLGRSLDERQKIADQVKRFYNFRSRVVHGGASKSGKENEKAVNAGISLCRDAIRAVVLSGQRPIPQSWELSGGPPWNRYSEP